MTLVVLLLLSQATVAQEADDGFEPLATEMSETSSQKVVKNVNDDATSESTSKSEANTEVENAPIATTPTSPDDSIESEPEASETEPLVESESSQSGEATESLDLGATPEEVVDPTLQPTLSLLSKEVLPGTSDILTWEMETSFQDVSAPVPVLVVNGTRAGPTVCLTAAIHGDELNGIEIVRRAIYELKPKKMAGAVIGVPIVNLEGFKRANRYLPDRRDLNRYFPGQEKGSYASRIAYSFFSRVITKCEYLIDLHTGSLSRTNLPQIRANLSDEKIAAFAQQLGSIVVLQSHGGLGTLRRAAADAGIPSITLEAGGSNNLQKEAVEQGVITVESAFDALGITSKARWQRNAEPTFYRSKWVRAREGGILFSKVELGDNVKKGTILGLISNPVTNKTNKIRSPIEGRVIGMALNQVMYPGFAAYHIGLKSSIVEIAHPEDAEDDDYYDFGLNESTSAGVDEEEYESDDADSIDEFEDDAPVNLPKVSEEDEKPSINKMELPTSEKR